MKIDQLYQETLDYIYSFVENSHTHRHPPSLEGADLLGVAALLDLLAKPHNDFPSIHVAGSKGKGSVSALCASALQSAGYKVGLFTSPHLKDFEERIQVNRKPIDRKTLISIVDEMKPKISSIPGLNTFEIITAIG